MGEGAHRRGCPGTTGPGCHGVAELERRDPRHVTGHGGHREVDLRLSHIAEVRVVLDVVATAGAAESYSHPPPTAGWSPSGPALREVRVQLGLPRGRDDRTWCRSLRGSGRGSRYVGFEAAVAPGVAGQLAEQPLVDSVRVVVGGDIDPAWSVRDARLHRRTPKGSSGHPA